MSKQRKQLTISIPVDDDNNDQEHSNNNNNIQENASWWNENERIPYDVNEMNIHEIQYQLNLLRERNYTKSNQNHWSKPNHHKKYIGVGYTGRVFACTNEECSHLIWKESKILERVDKLLRVSELSSPSSASSIASQIRHLMYIYQWEPSNIRAISDQYVYFPHHIVKTYAMHELIDPTSVSSLPYREIVMERVHGCIGLRQWLKKYSPSHKEITVALVQIIYVLLYLHQRGILHQDISEGNLVFLPSNERKPYAQSITLCHLFDIEIQMENITIIPKLFDYSHALNTGKKGVCPLDVLRCIEMFKVACNSLGFHLPWQELLEPIHNIYPDLQSISLQPIHARHHYTPSHLPSLKQTSFSILQQLRVWFWRFQSEQINANDVVFRFGKRRVSTSLVTSTELQSELSPRESETLQYYNTPNKRDNRRGSKFNIMSPEYGRRFSVPDVVDWMLD